MAQRPFHRAFLSMAMGMILASVSLAQDEKKESADSPPAKEQPASKAGTPAGNADKGDDKDGASAKKADQKGPASDAKGKESAAGEVQEKKKAAEPKKGDSQAAPAKPSADAPAPDAVAQYNAKLAEWKEILKELRTVRQKHVSATGAEAEQLEKQWNDLITKGETLLPEIRAAGVKAYVASKDDRSIERFLIQILNDDVAHDRYEDAATLSRALLEAGCEDKKVVDHAGVAAFCTNDFEAAEKYLNDAKNTGVIGEKGSNFLAILPDYKEYWKTEQELRQKEAEAPEAEQLPRVKISTTKGDMVVELFENEAPGAVGNFISLVEKKFYDGLTFHRVLEGFMAQGGCPRGDGTGGPGYNIYCEYDKPNYRKHFRGTLSMAHAGKDTGGSQFFLTFVPTAHLNGRHTAFGRVVEGMDVLGRLQRIDPQGEGPKPEPDKILKMEVLRKRDHEYKPNKVQ